MQMEEQTPADKLLITAYGDGGFRVLDERCKGSILVLPEEVVAWPVESLAQLSVESLSALEALKDQLDVLLIGAGAGHGVGSPAIAEALSEWGIAVDYMATGAACRTFNVLQAEGRQVAAALIAVE
jgi:uncharacterized protein